MLIRYPGSKAKLAPQIMLRFPDEVGMELCANASRWEYREPFFGAGAVGFVVLNRLHPSCPAWLNDADPGLVALWRAVAFHPRDLAARIDRFRPSAEAFYEFKATDGTADDEVERGFRKLALHQMSVSGFGAMSGGPLGGRDQANAAYPVDCRWNAVRLTKHLLAAHATLKRLRKLRITCGDFADVLADCPETCFVYMDPPYVAAGPALYKHSMDDTDHKRLAECIDALRCPWALSYDDHAMVRSLYHRHRIEELRVTYTNAVAKNGERPKNREVLVTPAI